LFEKNDLINTFEYCEELFAVGYVCDELADYSGALKYYKTARDVLEKKYQKTALYINVINNIAIILAEHGKVDRAVRYFTKARSIANLVGISGRDKSMLAYSIASCYVMKGDFARAALFYTESMKTFQLKGMELIDTFCNLGYCLEFLSTPSQAIGCFENSLVLFGNSPTENCREKYAVKLHIAHLYLMVNNDEKAKSVLTPLAEEIADTLGTQNMQYFDCVNLLSKIYSETDSSKALEYKKTALATLGRITAREHFLYCQTEREIVELYKNCGDFGSALEIISNYTDMAKKNGDVDTDNYVDCALIKADILRKQDRATEAIKLLEETVAQCSDERNGYVKCLLMLVHLYLQYGYGKSLYGIYDKFAKVRPGNSFDDMLDMSEDY
jgi:tetratricopeptide (TPR) repeat protein